MTRKIQDWLSNPKVTAEQLEFKENEVSKRELARLEYKQRIARATERYLRRNEHGKSKRIY